MGAKAVVVLDTNILVSALGWPGAERRVYAHCRAGDLQMVTSPPLLEELGRVLRYPKFRLSQEDIGRFERDVREHSRLLHPQRRLQVILEDPDDDCVLDCAVTGSAAWIITGDPHVLVLGTYAGIRIVTAPQALEQLGLR